MATVYYTCNLLPPGLVTRSGHSLRWLGHDLEDASAPARREALGVHPMTCPFVTRLVAAAEAVLAETADDARVIVPGGCDAMRRLGDLLAAAYPGRVFALAMPRSATPGARAALAGGLAALDRWLREWNSGAAVEGVPAEGEAVADGPRLEYLGAPQPNGIFVVAGPLSDAALLRLIDDLGAGIAGLESCTSPDRWDSLTASADSAADRFGPVGADDAVEDAADAYEDLAAAMLEAGMCPRRSTLARREHLARRLDQAGPSAVIYARQSFCDPGAYDALEVALLAEKRGLPFLELEVGFPFEASGPLRTRVEAFLETQSLDDDLLGDLDDFDDDLLAADLEDALRDDLGEPEADALMREES
jgi:hypothetical protein